MENFVDGAVRLSCFSIEAKVFEYLGNISDRQDVSSNL